jgi:hypothetical protein
LRYSLLLLLFPTAVLAQTNKEITPVYAEDYQRLIRADTNAVVMPASGLHRTLQVRSMFGADTKIKKITIRHQEFRMIPDYTRVLLISGGYSASFAWKAVNRLPSLQSDFVQGRSLQGALAWRGAETNEVFSYGPALSSLEYDGQPYRYDRNGKLVPVGTGNGHNPAAYTNNIFRTGRLFSQSFSLKTILLENDVQAREFNINLGQTSEKTFIRHHDNNSTNLHLALGTRMKWLHVQGKYSYTQDQASNANRNGFLNKVYQQSLLTPVSFDNGQGYTLGSGQRSYSHQADHPDFLLKDNGHYVRSIRQQVSLLMERNAYRKMKYRIIQSYDHKTENSDEGYKPGSAGFPAGAPLLRNKEDKLYQLKGEASATIPYGRYAWNGAFVAGYLFSDAHSTIRYQPHESRYLYQRSAHELSVNYETSYDVNEWRISIDLGDKAYVSNTVSQHNFFQPSVDLSAKYTSQSRDWGLLFASSFSRFTGELPISKSLSYVNLLRYATAEAGRYWPVQEVSSFDRLAPVQHTNWSSSISADYKKLVKFTAGVFIRNVQGDLFPVYENQALVLKNIGDYHTKGIDLELKLWDFNKKGVKVSTSHTVKFQAWRNKVTGVQDDAGFMPMAGFSDVHTALVKGQPLGVIAGSTWQRDAAGKPVIGANGFPLVAKTPAIIGDPNPDFVMKMTNMVSWNKLTLQVAMEWKNGGERWNGTQAVLDYYGRSPASAEGRKITHYIFPGVQPDGRPNNVPVDFYNPKQPVENNRWVRYGYSGVAANYIERADWLRLNTLKLSYQQPFKQMIQRLTLSAYVSNILLWTPYSGVDTEQLLFDQTNSTGLDFFNLPAATTYGFNVSLQF